MKCRACQDLLFEFVHDELGRETKGVVQGHLTSCQECALCFCRLQLEQAEMAAAWAQEPPDHVYPKLRSRIQRRLRPSWPRRLVTMARHPIPAYGLVLAATVPLLLWSALQAQHAAMEPRRDPGFPSSVLDEGTPGQEHPGSKTAASEPSLSGYDASVRATYSPKLM